jgi:hypothetical protein
MALLERGITVRFGGTSPSTRSTSKRTPGSSPASSGPTVPEDDPLSAVCGLINPAGGSVRLGGAT